MSVAALLALVVSACTPGAPGEQRTEPPPSPAVTGAVEQNESFTVIATGDVLIHPALTDQADADSGTTDDGILNFRPQLAGVAPLISDADLAICHLEVPLAERGGPYSGFPMFNAPPEVAGALVGTGYDACSTASNHTLDQGEDGVVRTLDTMDAAGLRHTGAARTQEEAEQPLIMEVAGAKVGLVSFTYGFNGMPLPEGKPWMSNRLDPQEVVAAAEAARDAGADVVLASLHWGEEYRHDPTEEQVSIAKEVLASAAVDGIIGHHAHVVQPIEFVNGKWVAYGLGNHIARHAEPRGVSEEGIAVRWTFERVDGGWQTARMEYVPTLIDLGPPIRVIDLTEDEHADTHAESLRRTDQIVLSRGAGDDGLTRPGRG